MKDLTVFVLTHNRGELLLETIESILNQTCNDFKFIVSDNSSNDETMRLLEERGYLGKFEYRKRDKEYPSMEHFNLCLSEVDTTYFVLFHDDDVMLPDYVEKMYSMIFETKYVAVGCNAFYLVDKVKTKKCMLHTKKDLILNEKDFIKQYCNLNIVPYPSYMYSKKLISDVNFDNSFGKYSDVFWLLRLNATAPIFWNKKALMYYRIHKGQDSTHIDFKNSWKLDNLYSNYVSSSMIREYRIKKLYNYSVNSTKSFSCKLFCIFFTCNLFLSFKYLIKKCLVL